MKVFQIMLGLTVLATLTACNNVVDEAKDLSAGAVNIVAETAENVGEAGGSMVDGAKELGEDAMDKMENASDAMVDGAEGMMDGAKELGEDAMDKMENAGDAMVDGAEGMMDGAKELGEDAMDKTGELIEKAEEAVTALSAASYTEYKANAGTDKKHVLFFHANWCPTCVKWEATINEALASLPEGTLILKANYDDEAELKAKYKITQQTTAVFINADGSVAKTEVDPSVESLKTFFE